MSIYILIFFLILSVKSLDVDFKSGRHKTAVFDPALAKLASI